MSRRRIAFAFIAALTLAVTAPALLAAKAPKNPPPSEAKEPARETASLTSKGEIVDCADFFFLGKKGDDRRTIQARHVDAGMPVCFLADADNDVYLLLDPAGLVKDKFQPTENYLAADVQVQGIVYQRGSLKALAIDSISRTGGYTDRQSNRAVNQEPNRRLKSTPPPPPPATLKP